MAMIMSLMINVILSSLLLISQESINEHWKLHEWDLSYCIRLCGEWCHVMGDIWPSIIPLRFQHFQRILIKQEQHFFIGNVSMISLNLYQRSLRVRNPGVATAHPPTPQLEVPSLKGHSQQIWVTEVSARRLCACVGTWMCRWLWLGFALKKNHLKVWIPCPLMLGPNVPLQRSHICRNNIPHFLSHFLILNTSEHLLGCSLWERYGLACRGHSPRPLGLHPDIGWQSRATSLKHIGGHRGSWETRHYRGEFLVLILVQRW